MEWYHKCDLGWLRRRRDFLTATDVKELLPFTKTGKPRKVGDEQYMRVFARKQICIRESDCESHGAAARGHVLEPYAIRRFNEVCTGLKALHHWDDAIVSRPVPGSGYQRYSLAFSPDALDIDMMDPSIKPTVGNVNTGLYPTSIGEVKCYGAERHMLAGMTSPARLEERWQLAVAMAVCPTIEGGVIIFYYPGMYDEMFYHYYDRDDLEDEIETVLIVEEEWLDWIHNRLPYVNNLKRIPTDDAEKEDRIHEKVYPLLHTH